MTYQIARDGQIVGSFSLLELQREVADGRISPNDLAQTEDMAEWLPVSELLPDAPATQPGAAARDAVHLYQDPPNLRWWIALVLGVMTLGAFFVVWDIVQAAWLWRVERRSRALILYGVALILFVANAPGQWASINHALFNGPLVETPFSLWLSLGALGMRLVARFVMRSDLCRHFTATEPIGMRLNWLLTLVLGGLYFQYKFNVVNDAKRKLRISVPGV